MSNTYTLKRPVYENCIVRSIDGDIMFYCAKRKAKWYLNRNLATVIKENPLEVQLNFIAKGEGNKNDLYYIQERKNQCVICGIDDDKKLTRHHLVPYSFRKWMPDSIKIHSYHDILPLCSTCHDEYEDHSRVFRHKLELEYNAPLHGLFDKERATILNKCRSHARTISKYSSTIPKERMDYLIDYIKKSLNIEEVNIESIAEMKFDLYVKPQGQLVVAQLDTSEKLQAFIVRWREHFVSIMKPNFLPSFWSITRDKR